MRKENLAFVLFWVGYFFMASLHWAEKSFAIETPANIIKINGTPVAATTPGYLPMAGFFSASITFPTPVPQFTAVPQFTPVPQFTAIPLATPGGRVLDSGLGYSTLPAAVANTTPVPMACDLQGRAFGPLQGPRGGTNYFSFSTSGATAITIISAVASTFNDIEPGLEIDYYGIANASPVTTVLSNGSSSVTLGKYFDLSSGTGTLDVIYPNWFPQQSVNLPWTLTFLNSSNEIRGHGVYQANTN